MTQNPSQNWDKNASLETINAELLARRLTVVQGSTIDSCISIVTSPQINTQHFSVGENQMSENYFKAIRSITRHPSFIALPATYRCVLMTILDYMNFKPTKMDDHGMLIELQPGQFMTTYRQLAELANVEKNHVERSLNKFLTMQISRHEVRHKKIIITLCEPYLSEFLKKNGETRSETKVRQTRDTKEEYKEIEEDKSISKDIDIPESGDSGDSEEIIETVVEGNIIYNHGPLQEQNTEPQENKSETLKKPSGKPKAKKIISAQALELLKFFNDSLADNLPDLKIKPSDAKQAKHFENLLKDFDSKLIKEIITHGHKVAFWTPFVHTPKKLEEKFRTILQQKNTNTQNQGKTYDARNKRVDLQRGNPVQEGFYLNGERVG